MGVELRSDCVIVVNHSPLDANGGVDLLIQSIAMVRVDYPQIVCCLLGQGALLQPLQHLCDWLNVDEHVCFLNDDDLKETLEKSIAYVSASRSARMLGEQVSFANHQGLPIVSMRLPDMPDETLSRVNWHAANGCSAAASPESLAEMLLECCHQWVETPCDRQMLQHETKEYFSMQEA